jgi:hypothetical protein
MLVLGHLPSIIVGVLMAAVFTADVTAAVVVLVRMSGQIDAVHGMTAGGQMPVAFLTLGDPCLLIGVGMVVVVGTNVADSVIVVIGVLCFVFLDVMTASRLMVVGGLVPSPFFFIAMGVILNVTANVADIVAVGINVVAAVRLQLGMLARGGMPMLAFIVKPG